MQFNEPRQQLKKKISIPMANKVAINSSLKI